MQNRSDPNPAAEGNGPSESKIRLGPPLNTGRESAGRHPVPQTKFPPAPLVPFRRPDSAEAQAGRVSGPAMGAGFGWPGSGSAASGVFSGWSGRTCGPGTGMWGSRCIIREVFSYRSEAFISFRSYSAESSNLVSPAIPRGVRHTEIIVVARLNGLLFGRSLYIGRDGNWLEVFGASTLNISRILLNAFARCSAE